MFAFDILVGERVEGDGGGQVADGRCGNAGEVQQDRDFRPEADIKRKRPRVLVRLIAEDIELVDILVWELRASDAIGGAIDFIEEGEDREFLGAGLVVPAVPAVQVVLRREEHAEGLHGAVAGGRLREVECVRAGVDDEARRIRVPLDDIDLLAPDLGDDRLDGHTAVDERERTEAPSAGEGQCNGGGRGHGSLLSPTRRSTALWRPRYR